MISYDSDQFGDTRPGKVDANRQVTPDDWAHAAGNMNNETIFRDTVSLFDAVDQIVLWDNNELEQALAASRERGYTEWPDGRALEDVLVVRKR